jgi:hypothetical protein
VKLFIDVEGKINYDKFDNTTTVMDLLKEIDVFLEGNPLPCSSCEESCCKKAWSVEMDNVCVNRLSKCSDEEAVSFVQSKLIKKKNYYRDFYQYVLNKEKDCLFITESNLCTIYEERPIICRLYICSPKSYRYNMLRELVGTTYLKALILEHKMRTHEFTQRTINKYKRNPAVGAKDYDIRLEDIFRYAEEEGWIDSDESQELS